MSHNEMSFFSPEVDLQGFIIKAKKAYFIRSINRGIYKPDGVSELFSTKSKIGTVYVLT